MIKQDTINGKQVDIISVANPETGEIEHRIGWVEDGFEEPIFFVKERLSSFMSHLKWVRYYQRAWYERQRLIVDAREQAYRNSPEGLQEQQDIQEDRHNLTERDIVDLPMWW